MDLLSVGKRGTQLDCRTLFRCNRPLRRERDNDRGSQAILAINGQAATVQFRQGLADRQTQTRTVALAADLVDGGLRKGKQDPRDVFVRDSDARIGDSDLYTGAGASVGADRHTAARRRELDSVRNQIENDLRDVTSIGAKLWKAFRDDSLKSDTPFTRARSEHTQSSVNNP